MGLILHHPCGLRHALFPAKVGIFGRRVLGCHPLLSHAEEELGGMWSHLNQNGYSRGCCHQRHSGMGPATNSLDHRAGVYY